MAQNIGVVTTLRTLKTNIRRKTGTLSTQDSLLLETQINDLVHTAILTVRSVLGKLVDTFYKRRDSVTFSAISSGVATVSIAALNIADMNRISLRATLAGGIKEIPIVPENLYNAIISNYSTTQMTTGGAVGTVYLTSATPNVQTLEIYTGSSTISAALLSYFKAPTKVTTDADTVDIPDIYTPLVEDVCALSIFKMLSKQAPTELVGSVTSQLNSYIGQLGLEIALKGAQ